MNRRRLLVGIAGLIAMVQTSWAQETKTPYNPSGGEMVFVLLLTALVIAGWVAYEWVRRKDRAI